MAGAVRGFLDRFIELRTVLLLLVLALSAWTFVELAEDMAEPQVRSIDQLILLSLRSADDPSDPLGPAWLEDSIRDITGLGGVVVLLTVTAVAAGYLTLVRRPLVGLLVIVSLAGAVGLSSGMKAWFERPRPDLVPHQTHVYTASFPSGHSTGAAATYLTIGVLLARLQRRRRVKAYIMGWAVAVTVAIGLSRVYLGVHWPSDVLAGWALGASWATFCWLVALALSHWQAGASDADAPLSELPE